MNISSLYTPKELTIWGLMWILFLVVSIKQGGAGIYEFRTPYNDTPTFCKAYFDGQL